MTTTTAGRYLPIDFADVPPRVRFDTPRRNQGQMVEIAYGGFGRSEHDEGDLYKRITDHSDGSVRCFRLRSA